MKQKHLSGKAEKKSTATKPKHKNEVTAFSPANFDSVPVDKRSSIKKVSHSRQSSLNAPSSFLLAAVDHDS
jgi:hypothetical protein